MISSHAELEVEGSKELCGEIGRKRRIVGLRKARIVAWDSHQNIEAVGARRGL